MENLTNSCLQGLCVITRLSYLMLVLLSLTYLFLKYHSHHYHPVMAYVNWEILDHKQEGSGSIPKHIRNRCYYFINPKGEGVTRVNRWGKDKKHKIGFSINSIGYWISLGSKLSEIFIRQDSVNLSLVHSNQIC